MFELNEAIAQWRRKLMAGGLRRRDELDELESHLHEKLAQLTSEGLDEEKAFIQVTAQLGEPGTLGEEFAKVHEEKTEELELLDDGTLAVRNGLERGSWTFLELLLAFSCMSGTTGLLFFMIDSYGLRGTGLAWAIPHFLPFMLVYLLIGAWSLRAGLARGKRNGYRPGIVVAALVLAILTMPLSCTAGLVGIFYGNDVWAKATQPDQVVSTAVSPDGRWRAYAVNKPTADGRDHRLMIEATGSGKPHELARLTAMGDLNQAVAWSPRSDVVVYQNHYSLFAYRPADGLSAVALLPKLMGPDNAYQYQMGDIPASLWKFDFPAAGTFNFTTAGSSHLPQETVDIPETAFVRRQEAYELQAFQLKSALQPIGGGAMVLRQ